MSTLRHIRRSISVAAVAVTCAVAGVVTPVAATSSPLLLPFQAPTAPASYLNAVACNSQFCFAATDAGIMASTDAGATWSAWDMTSFPQSVYRGLSCPSDNTCLATTGNSLKEADDQGWTYGLINLSSTQLPTGYLLGAVSCASNGVCAVEEIFLGASTSTMTTRLLTSSGVMVSGSSTLTYPASSWHVNTFPAGYLPSASSFSCSTSTCFTVAAKSKSSSALFSTPLGSTTWTKATLPSLGTASVSGVSCVTSHCDVVANVAGSLYVDASSLLYTSSTGGSSWVKSTSPKPTLTGIEIKCTSTTRCVEIFSDPSSQATTVATTTDSGATWSFTNLSNLGVFSSLFSTFASGGFSCSSSNACWVWGDSLQSSNGIVEYASDGANFSSQAILNGTSTLDASACVSATNCLYGGSDGNGNAQMLSTSDGSNSFSVVNIPTISGAVSQITCPNSTVCVAVVLEQTNTGDASDFLTSSDAGATWTLSDSSSLATNDYVEVASLVCPTATRCYAAYDTMAASQSAVASGHIAVSNDAGATWSDMPVPSNLEYVTGLSCPTAVTCLAVGGSKVSTALHATTLRLSNSSWSTVSTISSPGLFDSVSCFSATTCVGGLGTNTKIGALYQTLNGGITWTKAVVPSTGMVESVACVSMSRCMAVSSATVKNKYVTTIWTTTNGTKWTILPTTQFQTASGASELSNLALVSAVDSSHFIFTSDSYSNPALAIWEPMAS